jgi:hypothetical protein
MAPPIRRPAAGWALARGVPAFCAPTARRCRAHAGRRASATGGRRRRKGASGHEDGMDATGAAGTPRRGRRGGGAGRAAPVRERCPRRGSGRGASDAGRGDAGHRRRPLHARPAPVRVRRAGAAHRRADDGDPPRPPPRDLRPELERGDRRPARPAITDPRGADPEPGSGAGGEADGGPQQRRRARQPHDVLGDHGAGRGRRADGRRRRGDRGRRSATPRRCGTPSTRPGSAGSAPVGPG